MPARAKPFLRWAGSKQKMLTQILPHIPREFGRYYEPFLGSGALFFALQPKRATLSDVNREIISTWKSVRDDFDYLENYLNDLVPNKDMFYKIRSNRAQKFPEKAAELLYLNKSCWNGLYRVNSRGEFNVPFGAPKSDFIFDRENLELCSRCLNRSDVSIRAIDFAGAVSRAREGDFVFFDPPYVTRHNNNGFRDYNETLFSWSDQVRLAECATKLRSRGVKVVVTNAAHEDVRELYPGFSFHEIYRSSTLASDASKRGTATEALFVGT